MICICCVIVIFDIPSAVELCPAAKFMLGFMKTFLKLHVKVCLYLCISYSN